MLDLTRNDVRSVRAISFAAPSGRHRVSWSWHARVLLQSTRFQNLNPALGEAQSSDSGLEPLEEFASQYGDLRDELAVRKMRGVALTPREDLLLQRINDRFSELFEKPKAESPRVATAVTEAKRLLARLRNGTR